MNAIAGYRPQSRRYPTMVALRQSPTNVADIDAVVGDGTLLLRLLLLSEDVVGTGMG